MNLHRRIDSGLSAQDERSINALLIAYATAIDTRDWALFRSCFTADCKADYSTPGLAPPCTGSAISSYQVRKAEPRHIATSMHCCAR